MTTFRVKHACSNLLLEGCVGGCVLFESSEHGNMCNHPDAPEWNEVDWSKWNEYERIPEWCPLRKKPLVISIAEEYL